MLNSPPKEPNQKASPRHHLIRLIPLALAIPTLMAAAAWTVNATGLPATLPEWDPKNPDLSIPDATLSTALWLTDLAASFTAQTAWCAAALAAFFAFRHKWIATAIAATAVVIACLGFMPGRALFADEPTQQGREVRCLLWNINPHNQHKAAVTETILNTQADVVALLEPPLWIIEALRDPDHEITRAYPHFFVSERALNGFKVVLTKSPQRSPADLREGPRRTAIDGNREMILQGPAGDFGFTLTHPKSPRSEARWRMGNDHIERTTARAQENIIKRNLPWIAAGDLNAGHASYRSRLLSRAGFRRAKPLLEPTGTAPAWPLGPATIAIDDFVISGNIRVLWWEALPGPGSDHRPVIAIFEMPMSNRPF